MNYLFDQQWSTQQWTERTTLRHLQWIEQCWDCVRTSSPQFLLIFWKYSLTWLPYLCLIVTHFLNDENAYSFIHNHDNVLRQRFIKDLCLYFTATYLGTGLEHCVQRYFHLSKKSSKCKLLQPFIFTNL